MMTEVSRILSCGTHYEVLKLTDVNHAPKLVDAQRIRKHYKELAIQVHPDKTRVPDAEAAFKRLSEAYECLIDEESQRRYLRQLQLDSKTVKPRKSTSKRKNKAKSEPSSKQSDPIPTRKRTSEEIWQMFQREEEAYARQEFQAKGFERNYRASSKRTKTMPSIPLEEQHQILDSEIENKARKWATWSKPVSKQTTSSDTMYGTRANASSCCMLCRRKFPTLDALQLHVQFSKLHLANLRTKTSG
ncbi:hypothetical protein PsorP6_009515 [Peronosclerospora sorghi]|uniref:Uncharacterized protein n=1 Tax=Peronosclerospora sorghi TaxID=230839 RepID=A0ACC0VZP2_9STRA|nr:hypothetical protein PsorP6_009515 [Peronosclerospora sorghi]